MSSRRSDLAPSLDSPSAGPMIRIPSSARIEPPRLSERHQADEKPRECRRYFGRDEHDDPGATGIPRGIALNGKVTYRRHLEALR